MFGNFAEHADVPARHPPMDNHAPLRRPFLTLAGICAAVSLQALTINSAGAGGETLYAEFKPVEGASAYKVTYRANSRGETAADPELTRVYPGRARIDIPGVPPGEYTLAITALDSGGNALDSASTGSLFPYPLPREGFAFSGGNNPGAYNPDGTLKDGAEVVYVTPRNVNTVSFDVVKNAKGEKAAATGLTGILAAVGKGHHKNPLAIRIIGCLADTVVSGLKEGAYLSLQGHDEADRRIENVTIEGIGTDATLYGYGIHLKRSGNIELRNLGIMLQKDDGVSLEMGNSNIWIHNMDFFYGSPGTDADQVKGDGSIDIKARSTDITIDHCHFRDNGKVTGTWGADSTATRPRVTYHHNWFDHTDSRCPRLLAATAHVYNNYYDGVAVYGIGSTEGSSVFAEANYFRGCERPMMISGQGTDTYDSKTKGHTRKGTFSGLAGGIIKAFNNHFEGKKPKLVYQTDNPTQFDAWLAGERDGKVPATALTIRGAHPYSNFDTAPGMYPYTPDAAVDVPAKVTSRAGRLEGGDFRWTFDNAADDHRHDVNDALRQALLDYSPTQPSPAP